MKEFYFDFSLAVPADLREEKTRRGRFEENGSFRSRKGSGGTATSSCSELRTAYNDCFNRWYAEKYMKGQKDKQECVAEWEKYRACLMQFLEDKHLSRLLEAEAVAHSTREYTSQSASSDSA